MKPKKQFYKTVLWGIEAVSINKSHLKKIKRSLELIKNTDNFLFRRVLRLKAILIFPGKSYYGAVYERKRIFIDQPKSIVESSVQFLASSIIHEAWHVYQYAHGTRKFDGRAERGAYIAQRKFLKKTGKKSELKWLDREYKTEWWRPEDTKDKKDSGYDKKGVDKANADFLDFLKQYRQNELKIKEIEI
ncbi:MAG: hypothetical protein UX26_C0006G0007 [Parcubacteria group bacterium GW2011_GWC1_45_9]|nr:MAG: hypothetical protein UX26_C0006G0007 [Parcubacteria group bacterium GW2011_GWC1_45_9]